MISSYIAIQYYIYIYTLYVNILLLCNDICIYTQQCASFCYVVIFSLLTNPNNGTINCSLGGNGVLNPGETCTVTCDNNYQLITNDTRTCLNNGSWSGSDALCRRGE